MDEDTRGHIMYEGLRTPTKVPLPRLARVPCFTAAPRRALSWRYMNNVPYRGTPTQGTFRYECEYEYPGKQCKPPDLTPNPCSLIETT